MNDYSFIRLEPNFDKAKYESLPQLAQIGYFDQISLHPNEVYLQISNTKDGIAFDGNYAVYVVDCIGTELLDITEKVAIAEFTDANGKPQIAFEIANIDTDFYKRVVFLKFKHTVSDYVWYSNQVTITAYRIFETSRFDYRDFTPFYLSADYFQSIRLKCQFETNDSESTSSQYTSINGIKVTSRLIETEFEKYKFEGIDNFTYRRLNKMLGQSVKYVNTKKISDKQTIPSSERKGDTNIFDVDFKTAMDYDEEPFTPYFQIHEPLTLVDFTPDGYYTLVNDPDYITGTFNRNVEEIDPAGTITLTNIDTDTVLHVFNVSEIGTLNNTFNVNIFGYVTINGNYKVSISAGLWKSILGELSPAYEWTYTVANAGYSGLHYSNQYFI